MKCKSCEKQCHYTYCNRFCRRTDEIKALNEKWLKKDALKQEEKRAKPNNFHKAYAYHKEPTYLKRFKSVRG